MKNALLAILLLKFFLISTSLQAGELSSPSPTPDQLNAQISFLTDRVRVLEAENEIYRRRSELADQQIVEAYVILKKKEFDYYSRIMDVNIDIFHIQKVASYVVLFLVFIVVTSGVLYSGFQLWKSVSVAGVQASSDLEISAAKVRVTSSVVGIVVLAISLAFLFIYAREVYAIKSLPAVTSSAVSH